MAKNEYGVKLDIFKIYPDRVFWEGGDSHSRAQQHEFAEKPEDEWRPTCLCGTWTLELRMLRTTVAFGGCGPWTPTVSVESNWQWTRHLCRQSRATEFFLRRGAANRDGVALASARRKKAGTYLELVAAGARGSSGGVGPGGGRKMVPGGQHVCEVARKGQGEAGARCGATPNGAGVEAPVEFDPGVRCCTPLLQVLFSD